ncbi:MAG: succinate dehydrogenase and fumarate reductase iron-sulfur protein [Bacteroidetes bacterium]|nr:succinate dehydrogenase and fumarate reductase iron-sulfur protein [Bacteroidota bacterium]
MKFTLKIWRQANATARGQFVTYQVEDISPDASFLEMLDVLNNNLVRKGEDPVAFDHDCREGICGSCGLVIDGRAHGPGKACATCEVRMRSFADGAAITVEPWRAKPFPILKDLIVDRTALDRIMQAGGYVSARTGSAPDANAIPVPKAAAEEAMDAAACIGCGACVAACKNGSAMLFVSAKVSQLALLPQGEPERKERVLRMIERMDAEGFGACSNTYACEAECPKKVSVEHIARLNREYIRAGVL